MAGEVLVNQRSHPPPARATRSKPTIRRAPRSTYLVSSSGLAKLSRAVAHQLRTVARHRISKRLGRLEAGELEALERAISIQLGRRREP